MTLRARIQRRDGNVWCPRTMAAGVRLAWRTTGAEAGGVETSGAGEPIGHRVMIGSPWSSGLIQGLSGHCGRPWRSNMDGSVPSETSATEGSEKIHKAIAIVAERAEHLMGGFADRVMDRSCARKLLVAIENLERHRISWKTR